MSKGSELNVLDVGVGRPVLFLHGSPIPGQHFASLIDAVRPRRRVLVPDLPGYGASPPLQPGASLGEVTALLEAELSRRDIHEFDVVGHSLGAYRAFSLALSGRGRVGALVSLGGFAGLQPDAARGYADFAEALRGGLDAAATLAERALSAEHAEAHPEHTELCLSYVRSVPTSVLATEMAALAAAEDLRPLLVELACRVTLRSGTADASVPTAWSQDIAAAIPGAKLEIVPGKGHMLLLEDEAKTIASVLEALDCPRDE